MPLSRSHPASRAGFVTLPLDCGGRPCPAGAASFFQQRGWEVAGTVRSEDKVDRLAQRGIAAFHFDPTDFDNLG